MSVPAFVHLHNHTEFSLLDGGQRIRDLIRRAKELDMPAVAMTDHGNLFGVVPFYRAATNAGIKPIIGCEVYLAPGSRFDKSTTIASRGKPYYHMLLIAETDEGFRNLIKLVSYGYLEGFYYQPRIDKQLLRSHGSGLIATSGCLSAEIPVSLQRGDFETARRLLDEYIDIFGEDNVFLELQDHGLDAQRRVNEGIQRLHEQSSIPLIATNDVHFLMQSDHAAHDVLICIGTGKKRDEASRMRYASEHYFKSAEEMLARFTHLPEALENTIRIAERCNVSLDFDSHHLPEFPVAPGETLDSALQQAAHEGFARRRSTWERLAAEGLLRHPLDEYEQRLARELDTIIAMRFPGYFLITADFIRYAREQGIPVGPGRGSAAGSLVAYCLGITDIDPLQYDLLFERFLNPERLTMPDIDIDFCFRRRGEVIEYVTRKYGRENVAQIITFGTLAARAAIRDAGRVLGLAYGEVDRIAKLIPEEIGAKIDKAIEEVPALAKLYQQDPAAREVLDVALRLEGLSRHASVHAAGVVITPRPVVEYAPLFKSNRDEITTQWAKDDVEAIGLLKMDFLGLKTLTLIEDCLASICRGGQQSPDLETLPLDDEQTYELFGRGDTAGVFQFESSGMRDILRRLKPERFEDLIALNALYRPGPLRSGMIEDFIQRRHGRGRVSYPHPLTEPILRETYGVIVYQEQVMQIASVMAGYSLGDADLLRRAMAKKDESVMAAQRQLFIDKAAERGVERPDAQSVFDLMAHFAGYGFNKSHSAAYALVAYQTAFLKTHYRVHFMAAQLTTEKDHTDKLVEYVNTCRETGIGILPPDINRSGRYFEVEADAIRFGLAAVKGIGEGAVDAILDARDRLGRFETIDDLACEVDRKALNRRVLEALVRSGALDGLGDRAALWAAIDPALERGARAAEDRAAGQVSLFGEQTGAPAKRPPLPEVPAWDDEQRLSGEKEALGFYLSGHPLDEHRERLAEVTTSCVADLHSGGEVVVGGLITALKKRRTRQGDWMAVFVLEDTTGHGECIVFPKLFREIGDSLEDGQAVVVSGRADTTEGDSRLLAEKIVALEHAPTRPVEGLTVKLEGDARQGLSQLERIDALLADCPGSVPVYFEVVRPGDFRVTLQADRGRGVNASRDLLGALRRLLGPDGARLGRP
ncbi:MAG: DNA polymerase III subunit alpha [Acidobacteriota bacterium]|nr:MAG: DNA polymerase III subunit alpha [Acidobacteriota bacterium]